MFKKALAAATLLGCGLAHAFMPSNGTWVVTSGLMANPDAGWPSTHRTVRWSCKCMPMRAMASPAST